MGAFHAYDIRGRWNVDFDRDTVYKTGYFLPELLGCRKVAVGRDMRLSSPELHAAPHRTSIMLRPPRASVPRSR